MKTAISIPDAVFAVADRVAHELGVSRSELYVEALRRFLEKHHEGEVTQKLNAVYRRGSSRVDSHLRKMQARSLPKDPW